MIEIIKEYPVKEFENSGLEKNPQKKWKELCELLKKSTIAESVINGLETHKNKIGVLFISEEFDSNYLSPERLCLINKGLPQKYSGGIAVINVNSPLVINKKNYLHISLIHELGHAYQRSIGMFVAKENNYQVLEEKALKEGNKDARLSIENDNIQGCELQVCQQLGIQGSRTCYN